jgi:chromosome segregation ATPase
MADTFPVQGFGRIPWAIAEEAYAVYSARFGRDQSLARLAERGGFGIHEMDMFAPGWRERADTVRVLEAKLAAAERERDEYLAGLRGARSALAAAHKERAAAEERAAWAERERDEARAELDRYRTEFMASAAKVDAWRRRSIPRARRLLARARKDRDGWRAEHGHAWRHVEEARAEAARYREALERIESCDMTATTRADLCNLARAALDAKEDSRG